MHSFFSWVQKSVATTSGFQPRSTPVPPYLCDSCKCAPLNAVAFFSHRLMGLPGAGAVGEEYKLGGGKPGAKAAKPMSEMEK